MFNIIFIGLVNAYTIIYVLADFLFTLVSLRRLIPVNFGSISVRTIELASCGNFRGLSLLFKIGTRQVSRRRIELGRF